jgi:NDP-sugar pyrophosphorylase family protein
MNTKIEKAMVFCAGLGTRALPLTKTIPKPLIEIKNKPNLFYVFDLLKKAGIFEVILNTHHLADVLESYLKKNSYDMKISFSREQTLLGTAGGLKKAESFFEGEPFALLNCDFISNIDLKSVIDSHFKNKAHATLVLFDEAKLKEKYSPVGTNAKNLLCSLPHFENEKPKKTGIFTGIQILDSTAFEFIKEEPSSTTEVMYPALMKKYPTQIFGYYMKEKEYWNDTGELKLIQLLNQ